MHHQNGDVIKGNQIIIDTETHHVTCLQPSGTLVLPSKDGTTRQPVQFSSDLLTWDDSQKILTLENHVAIMQEGIGEIKTDQKIHFYRHQGPSKEKIKAIVAPAESELSYQDPKKGMTHKILCHGPLTIDHENFLIEMKSPVDQQGKALEDKQVYFEDTMGDILADEVKLNYARQAHTLTPTYLNLKGHVRILNRFDGHLQESGSVLQYALADLVDYYPAKKEMLLHGEANNRVLFFDKVNKVQISAPALELKHADKQIVKGRGDVRFTFIEKEFEQMKQRFHLNPKQD